MIREDWEVVRLGDKVQCNPQTKLNKWEEYDFLPMENIKSWCYKFPIWYNKKINSSWWTKFQNWDTVFARITPCLQNGKICKITWIEKWFGSTEYFVFRAIEWVTDSDYVFYLMCHPYIRDLAEKSMIWASWRQRANVIVIEDLEISLPPLHEQKRIASILSTYDDLIENNTRCIALLEQMAQTLYRQWFIEFKFPWYQDVKMIDSGSEFGMIPQGWEVKTVEELIAKNPAWKRFENKTVQEFWMIPVLDQWKSGIIWFHNEAPWVIASPNDPIIIFANHTCYQRLIMFPFSTIQNIFTYYPIKTNLSNIYWLHYATKDLIKFNDYKGHFPEYLTKKTMYPWYQLTKDFWELVEKNEKQKFNLQKQNQFLKEQRDLLLRKLIG